MAKISLIIGYATEHNEIIEYLNTLQHWMNIEDEHEYEVIIVSDKEWSNKLEHPIITKQLFLEIRGFAKVFNEGVRHATGDYYVISNCDQRMRSAWANRAVGAMEWSKAWMGHVQPNLAQVRQDVLFSLESRGLPAFFWIIPKQHWLGFDEEYSKAGGYHDDHDYCEEIKKRGGSYGSLGGINLYHTSNGHLQKNPDRMKIREENGALFRKKWNKRSDT